MKVLFAVSNENTSQAIIKKYQTEYKQIISSKNVYYFNAILKELQRDKTYDRIVIDEELEQYVNTDYEQMDKFLFDRLDSISDEASNVNGEDIPIILICTERRNKSEQILVKLFGIGVYNAIIGNDRSVDEVCRLINRPRSKKEAKIYYKIDADDVTYGKQDDNDVSELEIQNIIAHYKRIGNDENKYVESFDSIAEQYNEAQLKVISKCLPLNVKAVLEEKSAKYQKINSYSNKLNDSVRMERRKEESGPSEILLKESKTKQLGKPVVIPSAIDANKKKKILTKPSQPIVENSQQVSMKKVIEEERKKEENNGDNDLLKDIEIEELPEIKEIPQEEYMPEIDADILPEIDLEEVEEEEINEQPVKRGRGRPRKNTPQPVVEQPKRKRGRPKKVQEPEENEVIEEENILPGFDEEDEEESILPGFDDENEEESILPGFDDENEEESILPGFNEEDDDEEILPGFDEEEDDDDGILPGFVENDNRIKETRNFRTVTLEQKKMDSLYTNALNNLREEEQKNSEIDIIRKEKVEYAELDMNAIMSLNQKLAAFVGTSKNGTSFLVNNVAEILAKNGIDTAIIDLTRNRNSYYIYTKNDEHLRNQSNYITNNLKIGNANGIKEHKNLTIYTSPIEGDENLEAVEPIIETLVKNHTVVLMDCDFNTPMRYFKYAQEIYLVQSMDILTIQPLTAFLRQLDDKGMFESSKVRVVLNKFARTKELNEELLIGGISIYNDPGMTVRKELFDRRRVQSIAIPFNFKSYLRYLDGLAICDISISGYDKEFVQYLKSLASMVYQQTSKKSGKYMPPSVKNNNNGFSSKMNNTLNQMKQNY